MGKCYSIDLRERVYAMVESGESRRAAARLFDVSASFAVKLVDRILRTRSAEPARQGRPPGSGKLAAHPASLSRVLLKAGLSFKKTLLASETERQDVRQAREEWKAHRRLRMRENIHEGVRLFV